VGDKLVAHLVEPERKKPPRLTPEEEATIRRILEGKK
jgi:hypothetical protein